MPVIFRICKIVANFPVPSKKSRFFASAICNFSYIFNGLLMFHPNQRKMVRISIFLIFAFLITRMPAQLAGSYTVPGSFSSLASAVSSLNAGGTTGPVTIHVLAGYTETVSALGLSMTATGTSTSPIVFMRSGSGANPVLYAYTGGSATASSAEQDGIWRFIGSDYITIDGIDLVDPNTTNPETMEFGYGFFKLGASDGCNYNTIRNCVITLNRINISTGVTIISTAGSRAINLANTTSQSSTIGLVVSAVSGANSFNTFHSNLIQNCNVGISVVGYNAASPYTLCDQYNDIGGTSAVTGNTIINYGGGSAAANIAAGVVAWYQGNSNVSFNYMDNNNGSGVSHSYNLFGADIENSNNGTLAINGNTISLKGAPSGNFRAALAGSGSSTLLTSVSICSNVVSNCVMTHTSGAGLTGVSCSFGTQSLTVSANTFTNITMNSQGGNYTSLNINAGATVVEMKNNNTGAVTFPNITGVISLIQGYRCSVGGPSTLSIISNTMQDITMPAPSPFNFYFIRVYNGSVAGSGCVTDISNNKMKNVTMGSTEYVYFIEDDDRSADISITGNSVTDFTNAATGGYMYGYYNDEIPPAGTMSMALNSFSNIVSGDANFTGVHYNRGSSSHTMAITANTISVVKGGKGAFNGMLIAGTIATGSVSNNLLANFTSSNQVNGFLLQTSSGTLTASGNTLGAVSCSGGLNGVFIGSSSYQTFQKNRLYDLSATSPTSVVNGLLISGTNSVSVINNVIGNLFAPAASGSNAVCGINIQGRPAVNLFFNTVRLSAASNSTLFGSSALSISSATSALNSQNNILINLSVPTGTGLTAAYRSTTTFSYTSTSNNNILYAGVPSPSNVIFAASSASYQTLNSFKSFITPRDALSLTENTGFTSTTGTSPNFLHVNPLSLAESHGVNVSGIVSDIDGDIRQGNTGYSGTGIAPDIGADEFATPNCSSVQGASITASAFSICAGQAVTLSRTEYPFQPGLSHQWQVSQVQGGPYTFLASAAVNTVLTPTMSAGTYYYTHLTTCSLSSQTAVSNEVTVSVFPYPSVTVAPTSVTLCTGSNPVTLSASGAAGYSWSPSTGLNSTTLSAVTASPASTTIYTVTGINPGNCTGTATSVVVRVPGAGTISVTATPTVVCQGGGVALQAVTTTTVYSVKSISFSPIPTPTSGVGTLCNTGTIVTPMGQGNLNDGNWYILPVPFNFTFYSTVYNGVSVSTNGFITFGNVVPNTHSGYGLPLPAFGAGRPCAGAVYADLDFTNVGSIRTFTTGTSPNRALVINWTDARFYNGGSGTGTVTTQMVLYETSNYIDVHTTISSGNLIAVEGIQDGNATAACTVPNRNAQTFTVTNDAYRFSTTMIVSWTPTLNFANPNSSLTSVQNLQTTTTYSAIGLAGNGCTLAAGVTVSVNPSPTVSIITTTTPVCAGTQVTLSTTGASTVNWSNNATGTLITVTPAQTTTYVATAIWAANSCTSSATQVITVVPLPIVSISGAAAICAGQSATLTASGASSYAWNTGPVSSVIVVSPLAGTLYSVTGTASAGNCSATASHSLAVNPNPTLVTSPSSTLICSGYPLQLSVSGAASYSWSNGTTGPVAIVIPFSAQAYSVVGYNFPSFCTSTAVINVSVMPGPTLSISGAAPVCPGQSLTLAAQGASSYTWFPGGITSSIAVSPQTSTSYTVAGTNSANSCTSAATAFVQVNQPPAVSIIGQADICTGETIQLVAIGANNFSWSTGSAQGGIGVSPTLTSVYSVTGTAVTGCTNSATHKVQVHTVPVITIIADPSTNFCRGETVILTASADSIQSFVWSTGALTHSIAVTPVSTTEYSIVVTHSTTGCKASTSIMLFSDLCTGLSDPPDAMTVSVYPNPFADQFTIQNPFGTTLIYTIRDVTGRIVRSGTLPAGTQHLNMQEQSKGIYYLTFENTVTRFILFKE